MGYHTLRVAGPVNAFGALWRVFTDSAWMGVDLFFALSGFLITGILMDSRSEQGYFRNFYARRTLRIFPLYYMVVLVACVIVPSLIGLRHLPALYGNLVSNQLWLWTYMQNYLQATGRHTLAGFGHFWTLAVEEQFYWFWPVIVYRLSNRTLLRVCLGVCIAEPLLRWALLMSGVSTWALRQYTFTRLDSLVFGALAAIALREPALIAYRRFVSVIVAGAALLLLGILLNIGYLPFDSLSNDNATPFQASLTVVVGYSAVALLCALLIYHVASGSRFLTKVFSSPALRWFGKYSYAIYVFHWPVAQALFAVAPRLGRSIHIGPEFQFFWACFYFAGTLIISSTAALISWNLFEARLLSLKKWFEYSNRQDTTKQVAAGVR
jgi:peptidoglycan/LPS O-acetylase OafA/YrhL